MECDWVVWWSVTGWFGGVWLGGLVECDWVVWWNVTGWFGGV